MPATAGVKPERVRSRAGMAGAKEHIGQCWCLLPKGLNNQNLFKGLGMSYYRRPGQKSFFRSVLVSATQTLGRIQKGRSTLWAFTNLHHPRSTARLVLVITDGLSEKTLCLLVSAIQTLYNFLSSELGVPDCRVQNWRTLFSDLPRGLGMGYYRVQNLTA